MAERSIVHINLDESSFLRLKPDVEHERAVAVFDLLEANHFLLMGEGLTPPPYHLNLGLSEDRLVFDVRAPDDSEITRLEMSVRPFRSVIKDYMMVCESYFAAIKTQSPSQIEAIDMGRRGLHNEGADLLAERLKDSVELDTNTARRFFTLLCVLHIRA